MDNTKHNGWTNYATWRVNLEMFDGMGTIDYLGHYTTTSDLAELMKKYAENIITDFDSKTNLAQDYALAFLSDVNWYEIAKHYHNETEEA